jgi:hypothetical protein
MDVLDKFNNKRGSIMGVFDYKNLGAEGSKALFADAMAITLYTYHNLDNGFAVGVWCS